MGVIMHVKCLGLPSRPLLPVIHPHGVTVSLFLCCMMLPCILLFLGPVEARGRVAGACDFSAVSLLSIYVCAVMNKSL